MESLASSTDRLAARHTQARVQGQGGRPLQGPGGTEPDTVEVTTGNQSAGPTLKQFLEVSQKATEGLSSNTAADLLASPTVRTVEQAWQFTGNSQSQAQFCLGPGECPRPDHDFPGRFKNHFSSREHRIGAGLGGEILPVGRSGYR